MWRVSPSTADRHQHLFFFFPSPYQTNIMCSRSFSPKINTYNYFKSVDCTRPMSIWCDYLTGRRDTEEQNEAEGFLMPDSMKHDTMVPSRQPHNCFPLWGSLWSCDWPALPPSCWDFHCDTCSQSFPAPTSSTDSFNCL